MKRCVDMHEAKLFGMKSHDCHVFFRDCCLGPSKHLEAYIVYSTEFSMFFREICASELNVEKLRHLEASMPITLCKLEMVFPPSLFDSMEHLPVHLAYEAKVGGPQQYRWMYPFERFYAHLRTRSKIQGTLKDLSLRHTLSKRPQNLLHTIIPLK
ncbi:hypothetical protein K1719_003552 [Acacia pycnantha]|nr:hypothetical protein K1719_003552 [Acacia pycnantha]